VSVVPEHPKSPGYSQSASTSPKLQARGSKQSQSQLVFSSLQLKKKISGINSNNSFFTIQM
jgi:hypothetical protein